MDKESLMNIMNMVKEGTITAEEAVELINALNKGEKSTKSFASHGQSKKLVVRITPKNKKGERANITIPLAFAENFLKKFVKDKDISMKMDDLMNGMNIHIDDENEIIDLQVEE